MSAQASDDAGNTRTCTFDIVVPVTEVVLEREEAIGFWNFPLQGAYLPVNNILLYLHSIAPAADGELRAFEVQCAHVCFFACLCVCWCLPCPLTHRHTDTHRHRHTHTQTHTLTRSRLSLCCFVVHALARRICPTTRCCTHASPHAPSTRRTLCVSCCPPRHCISSWMCSGTQMEPHRQASKECKVRCLLVRGGYVPMCVGCFVCTCMHAGTHTHTHSCVHVSF